MDTDKLNDLIADSESHALAFFDLENASADELEDWDTYELDDLPTIAEFCEDSKPSSPFDCDWLLNVESIYPNEQTALSTSLSFSDQK